MVTATLSNDGSAVGSLAGAPATAAVSSFVQTDLTADNMIGSILDKADPLSNLLESEKRFPFCDLNKVSSTDTECKDDGETDDDSDDAAGDDSDDDDDDDDDSSGEDDDDEEGGPDSNSDSDDNEDSDDDDDDDEDSDDDGEEDGDDEEDEDEDNQPPCKKTK